MKWTTSAIILIPMSFSMDTVLTWFGWLAGKQAARLGLGGDLYQHCQVRLATPQVALGLLADCLAACPEPPEDSEAALNIEQAAARLGCSERTIYDMVRDNKIGHYRIGSGRGSIRFRPEDLEEYQRTHRIEPQRQAQTLRHLNL